MLREVRNLVQGVQHSWGDRAMHGRRRTQTRCWTCRRHAGAFVTAQGLWLGTKPCKADLVCLDLCQIAATHASGNVGIGVHPVSTWAGAHHGSNSALASVETMAYLGMLCLKRFRKLRVQLQALHQPDALHAGAKGVPQLEGNHAQRKHIRLGIVGVGLLGHMGHLRADVEAGAYLQPWQA